MLNAFRMQRQARGIQTLARLQDSVGITNTNRDPTANEDKERVYQELVNFHGEMLLLMHWSILAYTAIVKLLKKHHKRTGSLVQAPHLRDLLSQPSWSTEVVTGIISQTEMCIGRLQALLQSIRASSDRQANLGQVESNLAPKEPFCAVQDQLANQDAAGPAGQAATDLAAQNPDGQPGVNPQRPPYTRHSSSSVSIENDVVMQTIVSITSGEDDHDSGVEDHDEEMPQAPVDEAASAPPAPAHAPSQDVAGNIAPAINPGAAGGVRGSVTSINPPGGGPRGEFAASSGIEHLVNIPLLQQMHVALRTWDYLYDHASTPSTVLGAGRTPPPGLPPAP